VCLYFLAIFLPPLAVFFKRGCTADFLINILLSILGWIPGVIREPALFPFPIDPKLTMCRRLVDHWQARPSQISIDAVAE
jgi:uncharacterized membrane protein YqaE (UPF0057 family)